MCISTLCQPYLHTPPSVPFRFHGLYTIGLLFFFVNLVFFVLITIGMFLRWWYWPQAFRGSFLHPTESLFIPALAISIATILITITQYGLAEGKTGPWLLDAMVILFWIHMGFAVLFSIGIYLMIWSTQTFTVQTMTPIWIFPAYTLLLIGPMASAITSPSVGATGARGLEIVVGGFVGQGMGFLLSLTMHATYIYRMMTQKLPDEGSRPGMFISVGPSGFTVTAIIGLAGNLPGIITAEFMGEDGQFAARVTKIVGYWAGTWLWGLALIFFFIAVGAHWSVFRHKNPFSMTWNSFIFPNTALTTATFAVAEAFNLKPLQIVGCVMTCLLILMWFFVCGSAVRAVVAKQILYPHKQEDGDDMEDGNDKIKTMRQGLLEGRRIHSDAGRSEA